MSDVGRGYRAVLRLRPARQLAIASVPADFADWLDYTAVVALLVFTFDAGPWALALFAFALTTPYLFVGPALAVFIDQWPLKRVLVLTNLGRALVTALFILAPNPLVVLVLVFLRGAVDFAFAPARQAAIQASTPKELLSEANGLHQAINQASKIAGPALGGALLAVLAPQTVFGINALLSILAVSILLTTPLAREKGAIAAPEPFRTRLLAGLAEFGANPLLKQALIFASVAFFAVFLYDALIALLIAHLGMDAGLFGMAIAASGTGGLIGGLVGGRLPLARPIRFMVAAIFVSGAVTTALAVLALWQFAVSAPLFLAAMLIMGGSTSLMMVPYRVVLQRDVDPSRIARVIATGESVITTAMIGAPFLGSLIASLWGVPSAFLAGGAILLGLGPITLMAEWSGR